MVQKPLQIGVRPKVVAATLKGLRRHRRLKVMEMADAMGMPKRTYLFFEAGGGKLNVEHLIRFAEVTECDLAGLFAAILLQSPAFAVRCADNKLMTALVLAALDFNDAAGARMAHLTAADLSGRFKQMFSALAEALETAEAKAQLPRRGAVGDELDRPSRSRSSETQSGD